VAFAINFVLKDLNEDHHHPVAPPINAKSVCGRHAGSVKVSYANQMAYMPRESACDQSQGRAEAIPFFK